MSSRIHRGDEPVRTMEWRRPPGLAVTGVFSPTVASAQESAAAAYQQGLAAGEAAAFQKAQARMEPALAGLSGIVAELAGLRRRFRAEAEGSTVALAMAIARRVLHRELQSDPEAILGLVKAAFSRCDARETHRLRIAPGDAAVIHENRERLGMPPAVEIVADGSLVRGSAIFETSRGDLDASLDTQLSEIERGLVDVLRRRIR